MKYPEYKQPLNYGQVGEEILAWWKEHGIFEKSVSSREGQPTFVFYEGPPSANGAPGIHHVMARTVKDIFCRYQTLLGKQVPRKGGWDTHGLPIELQVEKELGITKEDIGKKISVEEYNQRCRETVMRFKAQWDDLTEKMGYWVDLNDPYVTFEPEYIESCWALLKKLYDKGLLYKGYTIQPYSPAAGTGLSSHELNQPGTYRDVKDTTVVAQFKVKRDEKSEKLFSLAGDDAKVSILAWTTTPWTLPANTGLAVGNNIDYALLATENQYTHEKVVVVAAKALVDKLINVPNVGALVKQFEKDPLVLDPVKQAMATVEAIRPKILAEFKGRDLVGINYERLFGTKEGFPAFEGEEKAFRVIPGDFVTTDDGTGIVHISPTFGADDFRVAQQNDIPALLVPDAEGKLGPIVDRTGRYVPQMGEFGGRWVKNYDGHDQSGADYKTLDEDIVIKMKREGTAFKVEKYEHTYPHCWRTDKPVLYYPLDSWFIKTTAVKDRLIELNQTINWKPESTGAGRFGNWLENLVDWNLSRSRYWGTPLPIWRTQDGTEEICIGSIAELSAEIDKAVAAEVMTTAALRQSAVRELADVGYRVYFDTTDGGKYEGWFELGTAANDGTVSFQHAGPIGDTSQLHIASIDWATLRYNVQADPSDSDSYQPVPLALGVDLHRPYVDDIFLVSPSGQPMYREPDLIDVWFDSGAMPYAQWHYPLENDATFRKNFPADFIAEGVDQTRGWFFTLHALAVMLEDSVAFKNVIANGLVLAKDGQKMSKRLGNAVDPFATIQQFGPDATRWYLIANAPPWDNLRFDPAGITEVQRRFFGTLFNTYSFYALYANLDDFQAREFERVPLAELSELDRWILSKLQSLIVEVRAHLDGYDPTKAARAIQDFVTDQLSNWYVRLSRRRFWKGELTTDKRAAFETLQECLVVVAQLMSPIAPFFGEWLYRNMTAQVVTSPPDPLSPGEGTPDMQQVQNFTAGSPLLGLRASSESGAGGEVPPVASVHLTLLVEADSARIDPRLEERMELAQRISSLAHSLRKKSVLKVRQPLQRILVPVLNDTTKEQVGLVEDLICAEINVKHIEFLDDESGVLVKSVKPNFKRLGQQYGPRLKAVGARIQQMTAAEISQLEKEGSLAVLVEGQPIMLAPDDVEIRTDDLPGWLVATDGPLTVALDVTLTDELRQEGLARELVNRLQNLRKESGLEVQDKIRVTLADQQPELAAAVATFGDYIRTETQALALTFAAEVNGGSVLEFDDYSVPVHLEVATA
ncbi:isoleucine--tRNA ligase [Hymenobacter sp. BT664]|uniref:Isoleucine--tRNA ligase n=1 Tax=Hymenobacter montanus TaxID=2771359 RepID=A0A927GK70_9BACT|nr:isoleucine--tRNA ligase [Hymenobacter montanus]MBD2769165.1 isoleucine--tRNA ligase [Hymenobacter montanus]